MSCIYGRSSTVNNSVHFPGLIINLMLHDFITVSCSKYKCYIIVSDN